MEDDQPGVVVIKLIDLETRSDFANSSLLNYLKLKFREPSKVAYSGQYIVESSIDLEECSYSFVIVREYNLLMVMFESGMLKFLDLDSYSIVSTLYFEDSSNTINVERTSCELNVILSSDFILSKYDLRKILDNKLTNDSLSTALIWKKTTESSLIGGFDILDNQLFVTDFHNMIQIYDSKSGNHIKEILPGFKDFADLKFLPNGDFIACGNKFVGLFKKDMNGDWNVHKELRPRAHLRLGRCVSIFYEEKSQIVYVSDVEGVIFLFTTDLEPISKHKVEKENYCLTINERNGKMLVSNIGTNHLIVLK